MWSLVTIALIGLVAANGDPNVNKPKLEIVNPSIVELGLKSSVGETHESLDSSIEDIGPIIRKKFRIKPIIMSTLAHKPNDRVEELMNNTSDGTLSVIVDTLVNDSSVETVESTTTTVDVRSIETRLEISKSLVDDSNSDVLEANATLIGDKLEESKANDSHFANSNVANVEIDNKTVVESKTTLTEESATTSSNGVIVNSINVPIVANTSTDTQVVTDGSSSKDSIVEVTLADDTSTEHSNAELIVAANETTVNDPLAKYNLSERMLISKLKYLMRNEVCGENKPFKLDMILPDILKEAKAGNCKYKCERYFCEKCEKTDYKEGPFVAIGNCSIWSDGLEFNVDYVGKLYGDLISYKIYFEPPTNSDGDEVRKLYKSGSEEALATIAERNETPTSTPYPVAAFIVHTLLSG